mmetsp:Transcript_44272/g.92447  ORF Transcript_44272/g.92447 Transcript_44272/m.92447 type:complete len:314 (-) Transcript_44272:42-983(-)
MSRRRFLSRVKASCTGLPHAVATAAATIEGRKRTALAHASSAHDADLTVMDQGEAALAPALATTLAPAPATTLAPALATTLALDLATDLAIGLATDLAIDLRTDLANEMIEAGVRAPAATQGPKGERNRCETALVTAAEMILSLARVRARPDPGTESARLQSQLLRSTGASPSAGTSRLREVETRVEEGEAARAGEKAVAEVGAKAAEMVEPEVVARAKAPCLSGLAAGAGSAVRSDEDGTRVRTAAQTSGAATLSTSGLTQRFSPLKVRRRKLHVRRMYRTPLCRLMCAQTPLRDSMSMSQTTRRFHLPCIP